MEKETDERVGSFARTFFTWECLLRNADRRIALGKLHRIVPHQEVDGGWTDVVLRALEKDPIAAINIASQVKTAVAFLFFFWERSAASTAPPPLRTTLLKQWRNKSWPGLHPDIRSCVRRGAENYWWENSGPFVGPPVTARLMAVTGFGPFQSAGELLSADRRGKIQRK